MLVLQVIGAAEHPEVAAVPSPCQQSCVVGSQPVLCPSLCCVSWLLFLSEPSVIKPIMNTDNQAMVCGQPTHSAALDMH